MGDKGLSVKTPKGEFEVKRRGLVQAGHRAYLGCVSPVFSDGVPFRRIRPTIEASLGPRYTRCAGNIVLPRYRRPGAAGGQCGVAHGAAA